MVLRFTLPTLLLLFTASCLCSCANRADETTIETDHATPDWSIAIHGGAGNFENTHYSAEAQKQYEASLQKALETGASMLDEGGSAVDVVAAVIAVLEDDSLFNAGRGAVMTENRVHELDASIMSGTDLNAGAVTGLTGIRNPIKAARLVMDESPHVFLSGEGAARYAASFGLDTVPNDYFTTVKAQQSLDRVLEVNAKMGTVGCVVRDRNGNLAAGTSTGGMTAKRHGRIGDSPVIGAGTWADNASCAVSCTGHGEYFIRTAVAHDIAARMLYGGLSLQEAAEQVVHQELTNLGGSGGIIAVDKEGEVVLVFNTSGMFRASQKAGEAPYVAMFAEE